MSVARVRLLVAAAVLVALPVTGFAQETTLTGTVTDSSGAVVPGVTVRAVHEATGTTVEGVSDGRGSYRLPTRIGLYRLTTELPGFTSVTRSGVELAVGQTVVVNLQISVSALQEAVTVTAEAPLVDVSRSRPSGVVGTKQIEELPVNGRNFLDLTVLAPGSQANAVSNMGVETRNQRGDYQLNVDGQQVTSQVLNFRMNPTYSRDAIAEFEFLANRFDATQGRSLGAVLNVITKSGTNLYQGTFSGYFRDDAFNAPDHIQKKVLPYSDQQISGTFGGPIIQNKAHFFASYEYEREPQVLTFSSRYPSFNINQPFTREELKALGRFDYEVSTQTHLSVRYTKSDSLPFYQGGGATRHPSSTNTYERHSTATVATLTQVLGGNSVNEIKGGYNRSADHLDNLVNDAVTQSRFPTSIDGNRVSWFNFLGGYRIGTSASSPGNFSGDAYSIRDQFTYTFQKGQGTHTLKAGGEFIYNNVLVGSCSNCSGQYDASGGAIPANIESLFPVWDNPATWNTLPLTPLVKSFIWIVGPLEQGLSRPDYSGWLQDDWMMTPSLTLNLGVRYDVSINQFANATAVPPFLPGDRPADKSNFAPRLGFAYSPNSRTVVRGGYGKYYATTSSNVGTQILQAANVAEVQIVNDGRADFIANPFNGPVPTYEQVIALGQQRSIIDAIGVPNFQEPHSYQGAIGLEQQIGNVAAFSVDFLRYEARGEGGRGFFTRNINLTYNPATGANYPYTDKSHSPYPQWGPVVQEQFGFLTSRRSLDLGFQKRLSQRWQGSATYTLGATKDYEPPPDVGFPLALDFGGEKTYAVLDQRHRAVFNGIYEPGYGVQLSGLYFYGSGQRFATSYGGDLRQMGATSNGRLRPNGTIVPRNNFVGLPIHRVDMRLQKRFNVGHLKVDGMIEVFNLFDHANYGSYVTAESNASYGLPSANTNVAYAPRTAQLGFRLVF